jgi:tripartite-type tricarboxylate transporter receptor subunit TctC
VPKLHGTNKAELRAIAILSKPSSSSLPGVPTAEEAGVPVIMTAERGFAPPKGAPDDIAKKLQAAIAESLNDPEYIKSSAGGAPVLAFIAGAEWQASRRYDERVAAACERDSVDRSAPLTPIRN